MEAGARGLFVGRDFFVERQAHGAVHGAEAVREETRRAQRGRLEIVIPERDRGAVEIGIDGRPRVEVEGV